MSEEEEWDDVKSSKSDEAELFVPTTWQSTKFFDNYAVTEPHHVTVLCTEKQLVGTIGDFLYSYVFGSSLEESRENKRRITNAALFPNFVFPRCVQSTQDTQLPSPKV